MRFIEKILSKGKYTLKYTLGITGEEFILVVGGGQEHIGTVVLAVPRSSLDDPRKNSSTVSVLNVTGHKDEEIARPLAEAVCVVTQKPVTVIAGVHYDDIDAEGIATVKAMNDTAVNCIKEWTEELKKPYKIPIEYY